MREFSFVGNPDIQEVIERDYSEIQRRYIARRWKSIIILFSLMGVSSYYICSSCGFGTGFNFELSRYRRPQ